jgi:hypothetical protein
VIIFFIFIYFLVYSDGKGIKKEGK